MLQRNNKAGEVKISGTRVFLMLMLALLVVRLLIWGLVGHWLFAH